MLANGADGAASYGSRVGVDHFVVKSCDFRGGELLVKDAGNSDVTRLV